MFLCLPLSISLSPLFQTKNESKVWAQCYDSRKKLLKVISGFPALWMERGLPQKNTVCPVVFALSIRFLCQQSSSNAIVHTVVAFQQNFQPLLLAKLYL